MSRPFKMGDIHARCSYKEPILTIRLPPDQLLKFAPIPNKMSPNIKSPNQPPRGKQGRTSLGKTWTEADLKEVYDLRQVGKSWNQIGKIIRRSGGAAQQQWIRMQKENHWLLKNDQGTQGSTTEEELIDAPHTSALNQDCLQCGQVEAGDNNELVKCSKCQNVYHRRCHEPQISEGIPSTTNNVWYCGVCSVSELKIGSALAENLHTALEEDMPKRGKKRQRMESLGLSSENEDGSERSSMFQELKALRDQVQELQKDKAAMQQRLDDVANMQEKKDTQVEELKKSIESLKASLTEKPSSPLNGWFSNAKRRVASFGGT